MEKKIELQDKIDSRGLIRPEQLKDNPGIYDLESIYDQLTGWQLFLKKTGDRFDTPKKLYGKTVSRVNRVWNEYALSGKSVGVIYTGSKGSGKTMEGNLLCNLAMEHGMSVIFFSSNETIYPELINDLDSLHNVVIMLDEFGKMFRETKHQDLFLTMFNDVKGTRKIFIITENDSNLLSKYILNRPGRFRYHYDFIKIPEDVYQDLCNDTILLEDFKRDLDILYYENATLSFDQVNAILKEHEHYPEDTLQECLKHLNLHGLIKQYMLNIVLTKDLNTNEEYTATFAKGLCNLDFLIRGIGKEYIYVRQQHPEQKGLSKVICIKEVRYEDFIKTDDDNYKLILDGYIEVIMHKIAADDIFVQNVKATEGIE